MNEVNLFPEGSVVDLVCRGWSRERILTSTGTDPGYHNASVKTALTGVDRRSYKIEHVCQRVSSKTVLQVLERYAECDLDKAGVLEHLGLHDAVNLIKLADLFTALGLGEEFRDADRRSRHGVMQAGFKARTGTDNPFKLDVYQEKAALTRQERYGAKYTLAKGSVLADEARKKAGTTRGSRKRYMRVLTPDEIAQRSARAMQTSRARYGVDHPSQTSDARAMQKQRAQRYGKQWAEKARQTSIERYGVPLWNMREESRQETSKRMSSARVQRQSLATKQKNGTLASSSPEEMLYELLCQYASEHNMTVLRQYCDEQRYPFAADFYIPERDLFIELNGTWSHGGHWYEPEREMDQQTAQTWRRKSEQSEYYRNAVNVWTGLDVRKREAARSAGLNYVTLWDGSSAMLDAHLWLALGCPDGHDWEREYSWLDLPEHLADLRGSLEEQVQHWSDIEVASAGPRQISWLARSAVWETFYARELQAWQDDEVHHRRWGRLRARLLANRLHYLGRLPEELSTLEVVRGLGISGEIRPYSTFVNTAMVSVLDQYTPHSLYDPCSGWGERMLTCLQRGVRYTGTDVSARVVEAHERLIERLGAQGRAHVVLGDSAARDMRSGSHEMVLTCPPYGGTEIYTSDGAENLDDEAFLAWWSQVVQMSVAPVTRVFAFQINEAWRERMMVAAQTTLGEQWRCVEEIDASTPDSHFQRARSRSNRQHRGETMVVFERL